MLFVLALRPDNLKGDVLSGVQTVACREVRQPDGLLTFVRMKGLEPPRLSAPDPKSGTATNYATSANFGLPF